MISGLLWDNDGVLVDTERIYFEVNRDFLRTYGLELSAKDYLEWFLCSSRGAWHLLQERGATLTEIESCRQQRNSLYTARLLSEPDLAVPGVEAILSKLSPRVSMGVVTSSRREHFDAIHRRLTLMRHFKFALTIETYQHSKPSPDPYLLGLRHLNVPAHECLAIEDSPRGLQAAIAAGIRCLVLRTALTRQHPFIGALRVVDNMDELSDVIECLRAASPAEAPAAQSCCAQIGGRDKIAPLQGRITHRRTRE